MIPTSWRATAPAVMLALIERFAKEGIAFAYPAQIAYTAAPDGTLVMPYPDDADR